MPFEGYLDAASETEVAGWVYHGDHANTPLTVEIVADGNVIATVLADVFREDLLAAGKGNGNHAFRFSMPQGQRAKSRLRARVAGQPWFIQLCTEAYSRAFAFMRHTCEYGIPEPPFGFADVPAPDPQTEIPLANRLIAAYHRASRADSKRDKPEDQWTFLERSIFPDFIDIIQKKDAQAFADYMRCFFARSISHGTFQGAMATAGLENPGSAASVAGRTVDALASLCESIGLLRVENPEQGHYGENLFRTPDDLVNLLESFLKIDVVPPNASGRKFGIHTRQRHSCVDRCSRIVRGAENSGNHWAGQSSLRLRDRGRHRRSCLLLPPARNQRLHYYRFARDFGDAGLLAFPRASRCSSCSVWRAGSGWAGHSFGAAFPLWKIQVQPRVQSGLLSGDASRACAGVPASRTTHCAGLVSINQEGENPQTINSHQTVVAIWWM